jgi:RNA polymerase sigma-B factor
MPELAISDRRIIDLALRWQEHRDQRARTELFEQFLPLARKLAYRYANPHESMDDLVQVASLGLLGAVDRFDPRCGGSFSAFAIPTILGELKRHFRDTGWSAHVPRGAQELAQRVERASRHITERTGQTARVDEIAEYLELTIDDVLTGIDAATAHFSLSLDAPAPGSEPDEPQSLGDTLGVNDDSLRLVETTLMLADGLARLTAMERQALSLRINHDMKQTEIARRLGCSQMQVSRLLRRAATKLREPTDPPGGVTFPG